MKHPIAVFVLAAACDRPAVPDAAPPSRPVVTQVSVPTPDAGSSRTETPPADDPWLLAYDDKALTSAEAARLQAMLDHTDDARRAAGAAFALGRRAPDASIGSLASVIPTALLDTFARGLAGRPREHGPAQIPTRLVDLLLTPAPSTAVATLATRFQLPVPDLHGPEVSRLLASGRLEDTIAGVRLIAAPNVPLPPAVLWSGLRPTAMAALARSLQARTDVPPALWIALVDLARERYVANPRAWANAWRALRDAVPVTQPEALQALRASTDVVDQHPVEPAAVATALRCENASAIDRVTGVPARVLGCAEGTERWRSLAAAAELWGSGVTEPARRAAGLANVLAQAGGDVRVLEAVASAAVRLPVAVARPVVTTLATSRDPGVLAALLEGLVLHVQHARAMPAEMRAELVRVPFTFPEPASLEARIHAIELARALGIVAPATSSASRAVEHSLRPDGGTLPEPPSAVVHPVAMRLVLDTTAGTLEIELHGEVAPAAVSVVVQAARDGRYDGLTFHRVVPAFVAQGGDPRGDGYGGTDRIVPTEISPRRFERATVGIALAGLDTGGMQFFVVTADAPHLDGRYPWIGRVVDGIDTADELLVGDVIRHAQVVER